MVAFASFGPLITFVWVARGLGLGERSFTRVEVERRLENSNEWGSAPSLLRRSVTQKKEKEAKNEKKNVEKTKN